MSEDEGSRGAATGWAANARGHVRQLVDFSGREGRLAFWPWVVVVFGLAMPTSVIVMVVLVFPAMLAGDMRGIGEAVRQYLGALAAAVVFIVSMLAAAVARRLHDSGRSGAYGLLPVPFLLGGLFVFSRLFSAFSGARETRDEFESLFLCGFVNNVVYLGTIAFLVFLLVKPSQPAENRHGPAPHPEGDTDS